MRMQTIQANALCEKMKNEPELLLIDVRTPEEFRAGHARGAVNVPLDTLEPKAVAGRCADHSGIVYMICQSGGRSTKACEQILKAGYANVVNVEGGTSAWEKAGLPIEKK